jgi:hypothetical protein
LKLSAPDDVTTTPTATIADFDGGHALTLEAIELRTALNEQRARRRAEEKASRWPVVVLAEVLKELRAPEPPELVDARDISNEEREEEGRRADA